MRIAASALVWVVATGMAATSIAQAQPATPALPTPPELPAEVAPAEQAVPEAPATPGVAPHLPWARIEQVRRGNRVVEVNVTTGTGDRQYTMVNREGQTPLSTQELSSGLSTPNFFKIEF